jgi:hypothetical protein
MDKPKELYEKLAAELAAKQRHEPSGTVAMGLTADSAPVQQHPRDPRDILLSDLNNQEQRLLDKMAALRELRQELLFLGRDEGERILRIARLQQRAQGI